MGTEFSIITDDSSSLQVSISGSRLEVLGFSHGRRVAICEEYGKITISLVSVMDSLPLHSTEDTTDSVVADIPAETQSEPVAEIVSSDILLQKLTALRRQLASEQGLPAYIIFHDRTLQEICRVLPVDLQTFGTIQGVGPAKLSKYGSRFLEIISQYIQEKSQI